MRTTVRRPICAAASGSRETAFRSKTSGALAEEATRRPMNIYETDKLLSEYLLFHYARAEDYLSYGFGPADALEYPRRCVDGWVDWSLLGTGGRALDLGCAVGRSTFELARRGASALGIDYSRRFVDAAEQVRAGGAVTVRRFEEGDRFTEVRVERPQGVDPGLVRFEAGDAMELRADLGVFDVVLMANLIDRLSDPRRCLDRMGGLVRAGGQLVVTSPYTWLEEFTPRPHWLGGTADGQSTLEGLRAALESAFELEKSGDVPFLIREHARKYQWSVAQATVWRRR